VTFVTDAIGELGLLAYLTECVVGQVICARLSLADLQLDIFQLLLA
jgi:hypothetical protein